MDKINVFWFRRDLRLEDNSALDNALGAGLPVLPVFIFDTNITDELAADDQRINFILEMLESINKMLTRQGSSMLILKGDPLISWKTLTASFDIHSVFINKDYEPYAIQRDNSVEKFLGGKGIKVFRFKDQVIFEEREILKPDGDPYTVFTPYRRSWMREIQNKPPIRGHDKLNYNNFLKAANTFPSCETLGFRPSVTRVRPYDLSAIKEYDKYRDYPALDRTTHLGPHLRFGTVSIRKLVKMALKENEVFLGELIWREFFMQILFNFPNVVTENFRSKFNNLQWRNDEKEFARWCSGQTGYSFVDAGMRQLNETGYMHNRVRMIASGFLCKHLLTDWRWGEAYFAAKLHDYELSSNNGNWQWAAGTGCDSAPYFRIFNPDLQLKKFDTKLDYIKKWIPEFGSSAYPRPMVNHEFARDRAISAYRQTGDFQKIYRANRH